MAVDMSICNKRSATATTTESGSSTCASFSSPQRSHTYVEFDNYFHGPRDIQKHSKWPYFLRVQGSVTPKMVVPLLLIGGWAKLITSISKFIYDLHVNSVLLTVLGFVVSLALSFRSTTAYEHYAEGRKYWAQLSLTSRNLARIIWIHGLERHAESDERGKADLIAKLTAMNLINAFAVSLKHRLRFEPAADYPDLAPLISNICTFAGESDQTVLHAAPESMLKEWGTYLGLPFAESNPRQLIKQLKENLGNIPLEVLNYLSAYLDSLIQNGQLKTTIHQNIAMTSIASMAEVVTGVERILNTPLPATYSIMLSQITLLYILSLPFQLFKTLGWIAILGTVITAYIILGILTIGYEIENPFGEDVNDLPLDIYCKELAADLDVLTSRPAPKLEYFVPVKENKVMHPVSQESAEVWASKSVDEIRLSLRRRARTTQSAVAQNGRTIPNTSSGFATFEV